MKFERFAFVFFLLGIFLVGSVLADINKGEVEWTNVPANGCRSFENETHSGQVCAEFNGTGWNTNITGINISSEEPFGPLLGFVSVSEATQKDYNIQEIDVTAQMAATEYWAEIELNTSNDNLKIDFGDVEKGNIYAQKYKIKARGNIDIRVTPTLRNQNDNIFSNIVLGITPGGTHKKIGEFSLIYNLTQNKSNWMVLNSAGLRNFSTTNQGEHSIKLDLKNFEEIIPFDEERNNTIKFLITPIWNENAGRRID